MQKPNQPYQSENNFDLKMAKYLSKIKKANLIEDIKFREIAKSKGAIEEILRAILDDQNLKVIRCVEQKSLTKSIFHGVILDSECILSTNEIVNVEMQVEESDNPVYRMRYNQSALTIEYSPKSKCFDYNKLPTIISIMICDFDLFSKNEAIYEVERKVKGCGDIADNGIRELYVNLRSNPQVEKLKYLFKLLIDYDYMDTDNFPELSKVKREVNGKAEGGISMSGLTKEIFLDGKAEGILQGKAEGKAEGYQELLMDQYTHNMVSKEYAANKLNISVEDFLKLLKK